ncbi:MAG: hypothetical protein PWQ06_854, partial [Anaerophaga sp.]|nr:hypothetical protein [Anaerophaga sp.]
SVNQGKTFAKTFAYKKAHIAVVFFHG